MSFLESLTPAERQAFTSVAEERTFARGARPMREGDGADYVMVIVSGWVQISVRDGGRDQAIAERGPGQLVGEVGALRVNVRSATVTALETVDALVMRTPDFASFLSAHQRVLAIIEGQIDDLLTAEPYRRNEHYRSLPAPPPQPSAPPLSGENCTVIFTDVAGFGAHERNDRDRRIIRAAHLDMMRASLGYLWEKCVWTDQGDGLLLVVPPAIPTSTAMECLHRKLPTELRHHNRSHPESARIQLRVAVTVGPVMNDTVGVTGEAIIRTSRLLDAPVLREGMASAGASLGIIVSVFVYDTTIRDAEGWADPDGYHMVEVNVKESRITGWMQLIDPSPPAPNPLGC